MKHSLCWVSIILLIIPSFSYSGTFSSDNLVERNGLFYNKLSNELFSGFVNFKFENGNLRSRGNFKNGKPDGSWEDFNKDGTYFSKGNYNNGKPYGKFKFYHENGFLEEEGTFIDGIKEGNWKTYWDNGRLKRMGDWKNGRANGLFQFFNYDGELFKVETWENGSKLNSTGST
tara:strand:+ start:238 stop:756 length:519 start_codon:yes stop_codon:yes gene_type:complete